MIAKELLKLNNIRLQNTLSALNVLRVEDGLSRVELAEKMHCDGTAVSRITRDLIRKGVLKAVGMTASNGGRPREKIEINADWKHAIGIELTPGYITGVLCNLRGNIIVREQIFLSGKHSRDEFVDALELLAGRLLDAAEPKKLLGIGVATFGCFSGEKKILEGVASYPALEKFDLDGFFRKKFNIAPEIADAAFVRMLYEIWFNNTGRSGGFLLFDAGAGIGCATAVDGQIVFAKYSNTGEFGHAIYKIDGDRCVCGRAGCLETLCSTSLIEKLSREKKSHKQLKFAEIAEAYINGDSDIEKIVNGCARWLGVAVANQINSLMPDEVVLTGDMLQLGHKFFEKVLVAVKEYAFPVFLENIIIRKSDSWEKDAPLGAASLLVRKVFEDIKYIE